MINARTVSHSALVVLTGALVATAFVPLSAAAAPAGAMSSDRAFVTNLLQEARGQLALAQLAQRRARGFRAKSAAEQTMSEWSNLRGRLIPIAYSQGDPIRGTLSAGGQRDLNELGRTPAMHFDRAYIRDANRGDERALARMRAESPSGDSRLQYFVTYAQPLVMSLDEMTSDDLLSPSLPGNG